MANYYEHVSIVLPLKEYGDKRKGRRVHGYLTHTDGVYWFHEQEKTK